MGWTLHLLPSLTVAERVGHFAAVLGIARAPAPVTLGGVTLTRHRLVDGTLGRVYLARQNDGPPLTRPDSDDSSWSITTQTGAIFRGDRAGNRIGCGSQRSCSSRRG
jgi:hypothetical protein